VDLDHTDVSDTGIANLKGLTKIKRVRVDQTQVTDEGVKMLRDAFPNAEIVH
jgi:hypothetical protein